MGNFSLTSRCSQKGLAMHASKVQQFCSTFGRVLFARTVGPLCAILRVNADLRYEGDGHGVNVRAVHTGIPELLACMLRETSGGGNTLKHSLILPIPEEFTEQVRQIQQKRCLACTQEGKWVL